MTFEKPLYIQANTYPARLMRADTAQLWDEGVMDLTAFKVTQRGAGANFSVDVAAGFAIVQGDDQADQGSYTVRSTATENIVVSAAPGSNSRYDLICLRVYDSNAGGVGTSSGQSTATITANTAAIVHIAGTAAASPSVPATPASCLLLAVLGPIATGTASVGTALIHDAQTGTGPTGALAAHLHAGQRDTAGVIKDFAGAASTVPNGWLLCDGSSQLRATYPRLFATIGVTYGSVDGTHFTLPDCRGRVMVALDNMGGSDAARLTSANTLGTSMGEEKHLLITSEMPSHAHGPARYVVTNSTAGIQFSGTTAGSVFNAGTNSDGGSAIRLDQQLTGGGDPHNVMQPSITVNRIIRT